MRVLALFALLPSLLPSQPASLDALYQSNQWFEFRDAMVSQPAPSHFYRGILAYAFHDWSEAEKQLQAATKEKDAIQAFEAALRLEQIYQLSGRRKEARALLDRMAAITQARPIEAHGRKQFALYRAELEPLTAYPDQTLVSGGPSQLGYAEVDNRIVLPIEVNGVAANYMIDTGASASTITESETKRLGLTVHPVSLALDAAADESAPPIGVAVARDFIIGNFHFRNVTFVVVPDDGPGDIIGLPVLLALKTLKWDAAGSIAFGFPGQPQNLAQSNLCLAGSSLLTRTQVAKQNANFIVDTGSYTSMLFPRFAKDFSAWMKNPVRTGSLYIGNDITDPNATTLAELPLRAGGLQVHWTLAPVLSREMIDDSFDAQGLIGINILGQGRSITLDFTAMKLTLDGVERTPDNCNLPPDFVCVNGWTCIVRRDEKGPCTVDRLPVKAWPGNPVDSGHEDGDRCVLSAGANCPIGELCRAIFDSNQSCHIEHASPAPVPTTPLPDIARSSTASKSSTAGPDVNAILQRFSTVDSLDESGPKDYVYLEDEHLKMLKKDGSSGTPEVTTREVMNLYGESFTRVVSKNGEPLSASKARTEQARFDKAVDQRAHETPEAKAKRLEAARKSDAEQQACGAELMQVFKARLAGSETVNGRDAWLVELDPDPKAQPRCSYLKTVAKLRLKVWIDKQEFHAARWEADNIAPVTYGGLLIRFPTGGLHVVWEQRRHEDGVWLPLSSHITTNAKALLFVAFRVDVLTNYYNYRKFQSDSRILAVDGN